MYKYFHQLDTPNDFIVLLLKCNYLEDGFYSVESSLTLDFCIKNVNLFTNLRKIDNLIESLFYEMIENKNRLYYFDDYEKLSVIFDYFNKEEYEEMKKEKDNLQLKKGNLSYPYEDILDRLKNSQELPLIDNHNKIRNILKRGYVEAVEFKNYANLEYEIPTVITTDSSPVYQFRKSYQKNIATLVIGHLAAE